VADRFGDGAFFVALASLRDPAQLPAAIASVLNLPEDRARSPENVLHEWARDRELLLVLDNLEQIGNAGPIVNELLCATPACDGDEPRAASGGR
jgi:predicted ATPase